MGSQPYSDADKAANRKASEVFHNKFDIWVKHGNGRVLIDGKPTKRNQSSFGKLVYRDKKKPQGQISKWYNAKLSPEPPRIPDDKLDIIIEIFNNDGIPTSKSEFYIHSEEEYKYNTKSINNYIKDRYNELFPENQTTNHYDNMFEFLRFLKSIRYDKLFPLWTKPIIDVSTKDKKANFSIHRDAYKNLPDAAPSDYPEFQIDKDEDGIKVLSDADMCFLYDLRTEVIQYIDHLLIKHQKDLDDMCAQICHAMEWEDFDKSLKTVHGHMELTDKDLILFDKYYLWEYYWKLQNEVRRYDDKMNESQEGDDK